MAKHKMTPTPADNIAKQIMEAYHPQDAQDIQNVVKRIFAPIFEAALKGEMQNHLGYASHARTDSSNNARNGYSRRRSRPLWAKSPSICRVIAKALSSRKLTRNTSVMSPP